MIVTKIELVEEIGERTLRKKRKKRRQPDDPANGKA